MAVLGGGGTRRAQSVANSSSHTAARGRTLHVVGLDASSVFLAKLAVDVGQFFQSEDVIVVDVVHVDAFAVGAAEVEGVSDDVAALFGGGVFNQQTFHRGCFVL